MAVRKASLRHLRWLTARLAVQALPALRRPLAFYDRPVQGSQIGTVETLRERQEIALTPAEAAFARLLPQPLPARLERDVSLIGLSEATLLGNTGAIVDERRKSLVLLRTMRDFATYHNLRPAFLRRVARPDDVHFSMVGSHKGHRHLFHFLLDRLPALYYLTQRFALGREPVRVLTNEDLPGFQADAYAFLAARHGNLTFEPVPRSERWTCRRLYLIEAYQNVKSTLADPRLLAFIRELYLEGYGIAAPERPSRAIFISRLDTKKRRLVNEPELHAILLRAGVEVIEAGRLSFPEQLRLFSEAGLVIGTHGAGLTNMLFASPRAMLLELFPSSKIRNTYFLLSRSLGQPYRHLVGGAGGPREAFRIAPDAFAAAVEAAMAALGGRGPRPAEVR